MAKTVLILGAGVTRAARANGSLRSCPPLDADFFDVAQRINPALYKVVHDCLRSLVGDYARTLMRSLEASTSYLYLKAMDSKSGSAYHRGFLQLLVLLSFVLARTTNSLRVGPRSLLYRFLLSELRKLAAPSDLTIITFNYDLVIERVLEEIDKRHNNEIFWFPGCYRLNGVSNIVGVEGQPIFRSEEYEHEGVAVLKLHGSMNWQSIHSQNTPSSRVLFNPSRGLHVLDSPIINPSLTWKRGKRSFYLKPVIVPPINGKRGILHNKLVPVWAVAATALREADRVVIAGYSCPPLDLESRILLSENMRLNPSKKVYVIDKDPDVASRFVELCDVDHVTVYNSIAHWIRDAVVP